MTESLAIPAAMAVLVACSGTISGSETAFFSLSQNQLDKLRFSSNRLHQTIGRLMEAPQRLLLTILILNNVINVAYFALASAWMHQAAAHGQAWLVGFLSLITLILMGEIVPKVLASNKALAYATVLALPMWLANIAATPLARPVELLLGRFLAERDRGDKDLVTGDELKLVVEHSLDHGVVSSQAHDRLLEVIDLSDTMVRDVMTHRTDCCQVAVGADRAEAVAALRSKPAPVLMLTDEQDDCVGLLLAQDILRGGRPAKRMRKPMVIPANASLAQALLLFKGKRDSNSVVVDEYGGTLGLLSLAHIGNEMLGPGSNADLPALPQPEELGTNRWILPGHLPLEAWEAVLSEEDTAGCTTIGGFVTKMLGSLPQKGDRLLYGNLLFRIDEVQRRRIGRIIVEKLSTTQARKMSGPQEHG